MRYHCGLFLINIVLVASYAHTPTHKSSYQVNTGYILLLFKNITAIYFNVHVSFLNPIDYLLFIQSFVHGNNYTCVIFMSKGFFMFYN